MDKVKGIREKLNSMADIIRDTNHVIDNMAEALEEIANELADACAGQDGEAAGPIKGFAWASKRLRHGIVPTPGEIITTRLTDGIVAKWRVIDTQTMAELGGIQPIVVQLAEILDYRPFSTPDKAHPWGQNNYEASSLASWLDGDFIKRLAADDRACIVPRFDLGKPKDGSALWLLSAEEAGFGDPDRAFDWYACEDEDERARRRQLKDSDGDAASWWLRTPYSGGASYVRGVSTSGALSNNVAFTATGVAPACIIG